MLAQASVLQLQLKNKEERYHCCKSKPPEPFDYINKFIYDFDLSSHFNYRVAIQGTADIYGMGEKFPCNATVNVGFERQTCFIFKFREYCNRLVNIKNSQYLKQAKSCQLIFAKLE